MASETKMVDALWIAPFIGEIGRDVLFPGETVYSVPADEAKDSDHWKPVRAPRARPTDDPAPADLPETEGDG